MTQPCRCSSCQGPLEPAQQLRFLVETDNLDNPAYLARIRTLPSVNGRPVPVCKACQAKLEANPPRPTGARPAVANTWLGALGVVSVGLLLGTVFTSRG